MASMSACNVVSPKISLFGSPSCSPSEWMKKRLTKLEPAEAEQRLREHLEHIEDRKLFVTVACFTGAELSALDRLDWTDVHLKAGRIRIPGTKNATRDRTIDLDPQLAAALRRVPPSRRIGRVLRPWANACTDLRAACKRAGIERVTPHTFRVSTPSSSAT